MKKILILLIVIGASFSVSAQFDHLISNQGYDKILEWDMNSGLGTKGYRFISKSDESLHFQSHVHNSWNSNIVFKGNRMGIGTTLPAYHLDVDGTAQVDKLIINPSVNGSFLQMGPVVNLLGQRRFNFATSGSYAGFSALSPSGVARLTFSSNATSNWLGMKDDNNNEIFKVARDATNGTYIHLPRANSRIIIGDYGSYLLEEGFKFVVKNGDALIQGTMVAEEVIVSLTIPPDYVFEKYYNGFSDLKADYIMPTLKEVANFTKENHHLPEVPSAKEIQENGISVSEMTKILLQKVEELTLYTIEQEERIENLEKQLKDQD